MTIRVSGQIKRPNGDFVPKAQIELRSLSSNDLILIDSYINVTADELGCYDFYLEKGIYSVYVQNDYCADMDYIGIAQVTESSVNGNLQSILVGGGATKLPPEFIVGSEDVVTLKVEAGGIFNIDLQKGNVFILPVGGGNFYTINFINTLQSAKKVQSLTLHFQTAINYPEITWPANVRWNYGVKPKLSIKANVQDTIFLQTMNGGQFWMGGVMFAGIPYQ